MPPTTNFVLAFGGTGARCAEALAYLAAARVLRTPTYVLLVDPDENNGNTRVASDQLTRYHQLHALVDAPEEERDLSFFSTPLNVKAGDVTASRGSDSFTWKYGNATRQWRDILGYSSGDSSGLNGLYELLYDEDDMNMVFNEGYVGRAHIGALDVFHTFRHATAEHEDARELTRFLDCLEAAGKEKQSANVMVIGSIFGGTGASGLPAIPPFLREHPRFTDLYENLRIGCVQLAPYFSFNASEDASLPDSRLHLIVTQSALFHYGTTPVGYDRVYLVGAPERSSTNDRPPVRGGPEQRNRAHYAELASALAVVHFFRSPPAEHVALEAAPPVFACYSDSTDYGGFPDSEITALRRNLVSFATACALHAIFLAPEFAQAKHHEDNFMRVMRRKTGAGLEPGNPDLQILTDFATRFLGWLVEASERAPELLTPGFARVVRQFVENPAGFAQNAPESLLGEVAPNMQRRWESPYHEFVGTRINGPMADYVRQTKPLGFYVALLTRAADDFCAQTYASWL
jgi:hypothetical protein